MATDVAYFGKRCEESRPAVGGAALQCLAEIELALDDLLMRERVVDEPQEESP
jgi:hypothetical protein